jgi:hypothetical protein
MKEPIKNESRERESDGEVRRRILKNEKVKESRERKREMQAGSEI